MQKSKSSSNLIMIVLSNVNVEVTVHFASYRLFRAMHWTFHVLPLPDVNAVLTPRFASHRLLPSRYWTFHVLRLSNMNVAVSSMMQLHCSTELYFYFFSMELYHCDMSSRYSFMLTPTHLTPQPHNIPAHCIRSHHIASSHHVTPHHITSHHLTWHRMTCRHQPHWLTSHHLTTNRITSFHLTTNHMSDGITSPHSTAPLRRPWAPSTASRMCMVYFRGFCCMVSRKVSRKSHRRLGETEAAELKAARRLVKEEDARKARDRRIEAPRRAPPARQDPPVRSAACRAMRCPRSRSDWVTPLSLS